MAKKVTKNEMKEQINLLITQANFCTRMLESVGTAFSSYIKFKGDEDDFKKYLENNKNLHKLSKEENESRKSGNITEVSSIPSKKIRKEKV